MTKIDIFKHYQEVKFPWRDGGMKYGIVGFLGDKKPKPGHVIVEDAILPVRYEVHENSLIDLPSFGGEYEKFVDEEFKAAQEHSDALPSGVHVGKMFAVGVADGAAFYVVTKANKKTCKVEWRGFCLDHWTDHHFGYGGTFLISEIARYID